jgi:signal transduction histidine kinase
MSELSSRVNLQTLRIEQETTHNSIRHAEPRHGRGRKNMQQRAREVGGSFKLVSTQPGTSVEIRIEHLTSRVSRGA